VSKINGQIAGRAEIDDLSLSWFGPCEIRGVTLVDPAGQEVLRAEKVTVGWGILHLATSWQDLGSIEVASAHVVVEEGPDGRITIAEAVGGRKATTGVTTVPPIPLPAPPPKPTEVAPTPEKRPGGEAKAAKAPKALPELRGTIHLKDVSVRLELPGGRSYDVTKVDADVTLKTLNEIHARVTAKLAGGEGVTASLEATNLVHEGEIRPLDATVKLDVATDGEVSIGPILAFAANRSDVSGKVKLHVAGDVADHKAKGSLEAALADFRSAELESANVKPVGLTLAGTFAATPKDVTAGLTLTGEPGRFDTTIAWRPGKETTGFSANSVTAAVLGGHVQSLPDFALTMHGGIDLGALGRAVPSLLRVRPDVTITSGRLEVTELSVQTGEKPAAKGVIEIKDVAGVRGGTTIRLDPVAVDFDAAVIAEKGLEVRKAGVKSSFAEVEVSGTREELKASFQADLAAVYAQMSRVFDMGSLEFAGKVQGKVSRTRTAGVVHVDVTAGGDSVRYKEGNRLIQFRTAQASVQGMVEFKERAVERYTVEKATVDLDGETSLKASGWTTPKDGGLHAEVGLTRGNLGTMMQWARSMGADVTALAPYGGTLETNVTVDRAGKDGAIASTGTATIANPTIDGSALAAKKITAAWKGAEVQPKGKQATAQSLAVDVQDATGGKLLTASAADAAGSWGTTFNLRGKTTLNANLGQIIEILHRVRGMEKLPTVGGSVGCSAEFSSTGAATGGPGEISVKSTGTASDLVIPTGKTSRRIGGARWDLAGKVSLAGGKPGRITADLATITMPAILDATASGWVDLATRTFQADADVKQADIAVVGDWLSAFDVPALKRYAGAVKLQGGAKQEKTDGPVVSSGSATVTNPGIDGAALPARSIAVAWKSAEADLKSQHAAFQRLEADVVDATGGKLATASASDAATDWGKTFNVRGKADVTANLQPTLVLLRRLGAMEKPPNLAGNAVCTVELTPTADGKAVGFKSSGKVDNLLVGVGNSFQRMGSGTFTQAGRVELAEGKPARVVLTEGTTLFQGTVAAVASGSYELTTGALSADVNLQAADLAKIAEWAEAFGVKRLKGLGGILGAKGGIRRTPEGEIALAAGTGLVQNPCVDARLLATKLVTFAWTGVDFAPSAGRLSAKAVKIDAGQVATVSASDVAVSWLKTPVLSGKTAVSADLGQVMPVVERLMGEDKLPAMQGKMTWSATTSQDGGIMVQAGSGTVNDIVVGTGEGAFRDTHVEFGYNVRMNSGQDSITLDKVTFTSTALAANMKGTIRQWTTIRQVDLTGSYQGTWEKIMPLVVQFSPGLAGDLSLTGPASGQFALSGPANDPRAKPAWRGMTGNFQAGWTSGKVYGIPVGAAQFKPVMRDGQITLPVTEIASGDGKIRVGFVLDLRTQPATFHMGPQLQAVENLHVSHDFKWGLLSKMNPMMMGDVDGRVSMLLDDLVCPLGDKPLDQMTGHGRLDLAQFKMTSAGPAGLVDKLFSMIDLGDGQAHNVAPTSTVFTIRNGRVEYEDFSLVLDNKYEMAFSGWVGLDDSIDMTITVPATANFLTKLGIKIPLVDMANLRVPVHLTGKRSSPKVSMGSVRGGKFDGSSLKGPLDGFLKLVIPK